MSRKFLTRYAWAATLLVALGVAATAGLAQPPQGQIVICHNNNGDNPPGEGWTRIVVPPNAQSGHFNAQGNPLHAGDYMTTDLNHQCGGLVESPTPTPGGGDPDPVPEPITMLLFGAGVAGVGYTVRRLRRKGDDTQE